MDKIELNDAFYKAYHSESMAAVVAYFLGHEIPVYYFENEHLKAMLHFLNVLSEAKSDQEPVQVLGMLCNAWEKLLADLKFCTKCNTLLELEDIEFDECARHFEMRLDDFLKG